MPVNLNFNVDSTELVKRAVLPIALRTELHAKEAKRRKLIAMAKECASKLNVADWNVVVWPPVEVTQGIVDILAASNECRTPTGRVKVAWELSGADHDGTPLVEFLCNHPDLNYPRVVFSPGGTPQNAGHACMEFLSELGRATDVCSVARAVEERASVRKEANILHPFWKVFAGGQLPFLRWSEFVINEYQTQWDAAVDEIRHMKHETDNSLSDLSEGHIECFLYILDILSTIRLAEKHGIELRYTMSSIGVFGVSYRKRYDKIRR